MSFSPCHARPPWPVHVPPASRVFTCAVPVWLQGWDWASVLPSVKWSVWPLLRALTSQRWVGSWGAQSKPPTARPPPVPGLQVPGSSALPVGGAWAPVPRAQSGRRWQFSNFGADWAGRGRAVTAAAVPPSPPPPDRGVGRLAKLARLLCGLPRHDTRRGLRAHVQDGKLRHTGIWETCPGPPARALRGAGFEPGTL